MKEILKKLAMESKMKIAIGIMNRERIHLIKPAMEYAEVIIVSPHHINGEFNVIQTDNPAEDLISMLISGEVDGIVRGDLSARDFKSKLPFTQQRAVLVEFDEYEFYMGPVGIDEGIKPKDRIELALKLSALLEKLGVRPQIGVLSKGRLEDMGRSEEVDRSLSEGKMITEELSEFNVIHHGILIEEAMGNSNIIICPDGISGNLLFRTMVLVGKAVGWGAPYTSEYVVVDTSRNSPYLSNAIIHASALARLKDTHGNIWS